MSKPIFRITDSSKIQAIPSGDLLYGWIPGTIVNFVQGSNKKYLTIDKAHKHPNKQGVGGFLLNGSYNLKGSFPFAYANDNERSGKWTPDEMIQRAKSEENIELVYDDLLERQGNGLVTVNYDGGCFKVYTFEKYDKNYLSTKGQSGSQIVWEDHIGELCGCSSRSLFTTLDNNVLVSPIEYRIGGKFKDEQGEYIYIVRN